MRIISAVPYLRVADVKRSLAFYVEGLGFDNVRQMEDENGVFWAWLEKDGMALMVSDRPSRFMDWFDLAEGNLHEHEHDDESEHFHGIESVHDGCLNFVSYVYVDDVDAAHAELKGRGIEPLDEPEDKFYGVREFLLKDPDGYYYAVAQTL